MSVLKKTVADQKEVEAEKRTVRKPTFKVVKQQRISCKFFEFL